MDPIHILFLLVKFYISCDPYTFLYHVHHRLTTYLRDGLVCDRRAWFIPLLDELTKIIRTTQNDYQTQTFSNFPFLHNKIENSSEMMFSDNKTHITPNQARKRAGVWQTRKTSIMKSNLHLQKPLTYNNYARYLKLNPLSLPSRLILPVIGFQILKRYFLSSTNFSEFYKAWMVCVIHSYFIGNTQLSATVTFIWKFI